MKTWRDLIAILAIFACISLLFCYPQLKGKELLQTDNFQWKCMAHEAAAYHDSTGKDVLWTNSMYGGMPSYTIYIGASNYNFASYVQQLLQAIGKPAYFFFIAMLGFFALMYAVGVNKWLSVLGSIAYAFATFNVIMIKAGHETQCLTMGYLPAALAGLFLIHRRSWLYGATLFALAVALMASNNHFQMLYYALIIFICFGVGALIEAIRAQKLKHFFISLAIATLAGLIGTGPSFTTILTTKEYAGSTIRGGKSSLSIHDKKAHGGLDRETAFEWSSGLLETFCIMIPYLYGGSSEEPIEHAPHSAALANAATDSAPLYWGPQPVLIGPTYFGAVICFLFLLGLAIVPSVHKWWMLAASLLGFILALGSNLATINYFLFDHTPFLNMFRAVTMAKIIPQLLFPLLGVWGLQVIINRKYDQQKVLTALYITAGITAGVCLLIALAGTSLLSYTTGADKKFPVEVRDAFKQDRMALAMTSCLKSAVYILAAAAILWAYIRQKTSEKMLVAGIGLLLVIDLAPIGLNYLNNNNYLDRSDYQALFQPREVDKQILQDKDPYYRVLDFTKNPFSNAFPSYFHKSVGGYSPALMEKYNDLIESEFLNGVNRQVLNMLNTKYIITTFNNQPPVAVPNKDACGNAWFVSEVRWAATDEEVMQNLKAIKFGDTSLKLQPGEFAPKKTAVINTKFKQDFGNYTFGKDSAAFVKLDKYGLDDISFVSANSTDGLAVFSDIYYSKGWKAFVDGKETPIMKADYVLRAIKVPAGNHKIEFHFVPASFYIGHRIALFSSICLALLSICSLFWYIKGLGYKITPADIPDAPAFSNLPKAAPWPSRQAKRHVPKRSM